MAKPTDGNQRGARTNAEGQHGDRTHEALQEQLRSSGRDERDESTRGEGPRDLDKSSRLAAGLQRREQHDEADLKSHKNRLGKELAREGRGDEADSHPDLNGGFGMGGSN